MEIQRKNKDKKNKVIKSFAIDEDLWNAFKIECEDWGQSMSGLISEFIERVTLLLQTEEGGEVVFGVSGPNWKQPKKIVYDGREITERNGVRQYDSKEKEGVKKKA